MKDSLFLEKLYLLLESARISINTVEDYIEFYKTGNLSKPIDIPPEQIIEFRLETVGEKPQAGHLDIIRDKTDDITIILDNLIDEISSLKKVQ